MARPQCDTPPPIVLWWVGEREMAMAMAGSRTYNNYTNKNFQKTQWSQTLFESARLSWVLYYVLGIACKKCCKPWMKVIPLMEKQISLCILLYK
jgi:hypothetical protein